MSGACNLSVVPYFSNHVRTPRLLYLLDLVEVRGDLSVNELVAAGRLDYHVGLCFLAACMPEDQVLHDDGGTRLYFHTPVEKTSAAVTRAPSSLPDYLPASSGSRLGVVATGQDGSRWPIATVTPKYAVKQNREVVEDAKIIASEWGTEIDRVGRNGNGSLIAIGFAPRVDQVQLSLGGTVNFSTYLFTSSGHNGKKAYEFGLIGVDDRDSRIVFGLSPALVGDRERASALKMNHTRGILESGAIPKALKVLREEMSKFLEDVQFLAGTPVSALVARKLVAMLYGKDEWPEEEEGQSNPQSPLSELKMVLETFERESSAIAGSGWGLYVSWLKVEFRENFEMGASFSRSLALMGLLSSKSQSDLKAMQQARTDLCKALREI